ncbi:hypothetical protein [Dactylosporangium vinaceum]|uniref:Uncharacterized protein n=1 Tax=Dactylosporangium vinaceum TaxID=53362 RepID=A0ABV5MAA9_9ACTN|nr:hypothetical protein [Dactylosporangium vinaceum]
MSGGGAVRGNDDLAGILAVGLAVAVVLSAVPNAIWWRSRAAT